MKAVRYDHSRKASWDDVVGCARNATFLFRRDYMDYHRERFADCSLLFYNDKGDCLACLPANYDEENRQVVTHGGLTYGGLVMTPRVSYGECAEMLDCASRYYHRMGAQSFLYKPVPHIYHRQPSEEDLYWLFSRGATLHSRAISSCVDLAEPPGLSTLRRRKMRLAERSGLVLCEDGSAEALKAFWEILSELLCSKHHTRPTHSYEEILCLQQRFADGIKLFSVKNAQGVIIAGCVVYLMSDVAHVQYIAANEEGKSCGALDYLFGHLIKVFARQGLRYFDFGISTENGGRVLNEGLLFQKEGFGGRAVCYDSYLLPPDKFLNV